MVEDCVPIIDTWREMEKIVNEGLIRNIGVCNFNISILRDLIYSSTIKPSVLQVELHPFLSQKVVQRYCRENQIAMTSFSTMGASSYIEIGMAGEDERMSNN